MVGDDLDLAHPLCTGHFAGGVIGRFDHAAAARRDERDALLFQMKWVK